MFIKFCKQTVCVLICRALHTGLSFIVVHGRAKEMQAEQEREQEASKDGFIGGQSAVSESLIIEHGDD